MESSVNEGNIAHLLFVKEYGRFEKPLVKSANVITVLVGLKSPIVIRGSTMAFALLEGIEELLIFRGEDCSGVCFFKLGLSYYGGCVRASSSSSIILQAASLGEPFRLDTLLACRNRWGDIADC